MDRKTPHARREIISKGLPQRQGLQNHRERHISLLSSTTSLVSSFPSGFCRWLLPPQLMKDASPGSKGWGLHYLTSILKPFVFSSPFFLHLGELTTKKKKYRHYFLWDTSQYLGVKKIIN